MDDPFEAPEVIYLQAWATEVSWCVDEIGGPCDELDVKYIRADVVKAQLVDAWGEGFADGDDDGCGMVLNPYKEKS